MKKIILFIVIFIYIYPVFLKTLPIPLDRVLQIAGLGVLLLNPNELLKIINSKYVQNFFLITLFLTAFSVIVQVRIVGQYDFTFIIRIINTFFYLLSSYFVFSVSRWTYGTVRLHHIFRYIVYAAVVQCIISLVFFIEPSYFEKYFSLLNEDNEAYIKRITLIKYRFIGVGSEFFGGVIKYGVAFLSVLLLPYFQESKKSVFSNKTFYSLSIGLIVLGGIMTGRTFFIAIILGIIMASALKAESLHKFVLNNIKIFIGIVLAFPFLYLLLNLFVEPNRMDRILGWAFEFLVDFDANDGVETSSTNRMAEMLILPDSIGTWLMGDGRFTDPSGGYYMHTDIGYIRMLFYFGLPITLFFIYVLFRYSKILYSIKPSRVLKYFFITIFFWFIILNIKGFAFHSYYFTLFLIFLTFSEGTRNKPSSFGHYLQ